MLAVALIAAPLLLVAGSWNEITAGPAAADVAAPNDAAPAQDEADPASDDAESPDDAEPQAPVDSVSPEPEGPGAGTEATAPTEARGP